MPKLGERSYGKRLGEKMKWRLGRTYKPFKCMICGKEIEYLANSYFRYKTIHEYPIPGDPFTVKISYQRETICTNPECAKFAEINGIHEKRHKRYKPTYKFTPEEREFIKRNYRKLTLEEMGKALGKSPRSISGYITRAPWSRHYEKWQPEEEDFLAEKMFVMSQQMLASRLRRRPDAIRGKINELVQNRPEFAKVYYGFSAEEAYKAIERYKDGTRPEFIAMDMGRTVSEAAMLINDYNAGKIKLKATKVEDRE